eukprot:TRINITY_DN32039_c0_g1_i1.p1 TRINITY_DN32039_c0_g1~~TRINITY_DN32039_c0_g1_i1.p1  ORF type:complete len:322 (+),score=7.77 TRINITY_DN32039_c0_g1_i1:91-966(+)
MGPNSGVSPRSVPCHSAPLPVVQTSSLTSVGPSSLASGQPPLHSAPLLPVKATSQTSPLGSSKTIALPQSSASIILPVAAVSSGSVISNVVPQSITSSPAATNAHGVVGSLSMQPTLGQPIASPTSGSGVSQHASGTPISPVVLTSTTMAPPITCSIPMVPAPVMNRIDAARPHFVSAAQQLVTRVDQAGLKLMSLADQGCQRMQPYVMPVCDRTAQLAQDYRSQYHEQYTVPAFQRATATIGTIHQEYTMPALRRIQDAPVMQQYVMQPLNRFASPAAREQGADVSDAQE